MSGTKEAAAAKSGGSAVHDYAAAQVPAIGEICGKLQAEIDKALPTAASRIWHGGPVWFIGENPVVGYSVRSKQVDLLFWSGQLFDEPLLAAKGKDKAAQVSFEDASEIKTSELRRWLKKAGTTIFDYSGAYAKKRAAAKLRA